MTDYLSLVREFHKKVGHPVGSNPQLIPQKLFAHRVRLIVEEFAEYCKAVAEEDIVEIADALADLLVVTFGTALAHGLPMDKIFAQVGDSNLSKAGGHNDAGGKWIKPDTYKPVNLSWLLTLQQRKEDNAGNHSNKTGSVPL